MEKEKKRQRRVRKNARRHGKMRIRTDIMKHYAILEIKPFPVLKLSTSLITPICELSIFMGIDIKRLVFSLIRIKKNKKSMIGYYRLKDIK